MKNLFRLIIVVIAFSCNSFEENTVIENLPETNVESFDFKPPMIINGVLKFENEESLFFWLNETRKMTPTEFANWEQKLGFKSFLTLYEKLVDEENEASDSLTQAFNNSRIMPERLHSEFPIHSKNTLPYLPYLYIFDGGGIAPLASILENGMERLVNEQSEVIIGDQFVQYKNNSKLINGNILKNSVNGLNLLVTPSPTGYSERHTSTDGNYRTITDLTFTIRQSSVFLNQNFGPLPTYGTNTSPEWNILLRNFRKGFFGWNTRKTTSLKMVGNFNHSWSTCGDINPYLPPSYNGMININSGGSSTTSIEWNFIDPNLKFNQCYNSPIEDQFRWSSNFNIEITGENNNVSNFVGYYNYQPN